MSTQRPNVGVGVFVFKRGSFLMGKRQGAHGEGSWSVPGGHLEWGEALEQTAAREVKEETGIIIKKIRFGAITNDVFEKENKHYLTVWMLSDWDWGQEAITEPDSYVEMGWYNFDLLPSPLFLPWQQLLKSKFINKIKKELASSA